MPHGGSSWFPNLSRDVELAAHLSSKAYPRVFWGLAKTTDLEILVSDAEHLHKKTQHIPIAELREVVTGYVTRWRTASIAEPNPNKKQAAGRVAANTWIRNYNHRDEAER